MRNTRLIEELHGKLLPYRRTLSVSAERRPTCFNLIGIISFSTAPTTPSTSSTKSQPPIINSLRTDAHHVSASTAHLSTCRPRLISWSEVKLWHNRFVVQFIGFYRASLTNSFFYEYLRYRYMIRIYKIDYCRKRGFCNLFCAV